MKLLATGGSGFVGSHVIPKAVAAGHDVVALARSARAAERVRSLGATPVEGDLSDRALKLPNIDAVLHMGAYFRLAGPRRPYFDVNVEGSKRLVRAASAAGAQTFVDLSAAAVIMDDRGSPIVDADETAPSFPRSSVAYIASKARAEDHVLKADGKGMRTIAIRPPGIWGKGDAFSTHLPTMAAKNQFAWIDRGDYPYVTCHVDNLAEALLLALDAPPEAYGRAYFVNDAEPTTFRAFVLGLSQALGVDLSRARSMPYGLVRFAGRMMELGTALRGGREDPPISRGMVRLIGRPFTTCDKAARDVLGYRSLTTRATGLSALRAHRGSLSHG